MRIPTMQVKIGDQVVIINVADFDDKIHVRLDEKPKPKKRTAR